jgi:hypothetical protein
MCFDDLFLDILFRGEQVGTATYDDTISLQPRDVVYLGIAVVMLPTMEQFERMVEDCSQHYNATTNTTTGGVMTLVTKGELKAIAAWGKDYGTLPIDVTTVHAC